MPKSCSQDAYLIEYLIRIKRLNLDLSNLLNREQHVIHHTQFCVIHNYEPKFIIENQIRNKYVYDFYILCKCIFIFVHVMMKAVSVTRHKHAVHQVRLATTKRKTGFSLMES